METGVDIIGIGGAGGLLASTLMRGLLFPRIIARGAALMQLRETGLTIDTEQRRTVFAPITCSTLDDVAHLAPVVFLATKSYDIQGLLAKVAARITDETLVIAVQNGFAAYDLIREAFGGERTAMSVLYVGAQIVAPAVIDIKPGVAQLFLPLVQRNQLETVVNTLEMGGMEAALVADIEQRMWMKQLFLVPFAIVNVEMQQPIGMVRENAQARQRWGAIAQEIASIALACGVSMPADPAAASLAVAGRFDPQADSSFARDYWAGRRHEADALFTPLLQRAAQHRLACPLLQEAYKRFSTH